MGRVREWYRKQKKWKLAVGGLVFMGLMGVGSVELTSQSWFCNSCHIMNPYYDSWKTGTHKDVECVKCHIAPGTENFLAAKFNGLGQVVDDVLHRTSPKPSASVSNFSCTRSGCHNIERIRVTEKGGGNFKFKHDKHLDLEYQGLKLACGSCHSHVKGVNHFQVNTDVCITCHLVETEPGLHANVTNGVERTSPVIRMTVRNVRSPSAAPPSTPDLNAPKIPPATCTTCHNPPDHVLERNGLKVDHAEFIAYGAACESCHRGATATPPPIDDGRCLECHTFGIERVGNLEELHKTHAEGRHKIECSSCHGTVAHGTNARTGTLDQFDCKRCHLDQHAVQRATYLTAGASAHAPDGAPAVSPMFLAHVDCTGCHTKERPVSVKPDSGARVTAAAPEACDRCHKAGLGEQLVPLWQRTTHTLYDQLAAQIKAAEADPDMDKTVLEQTRKILELVRVDGSWGVHNPKYTQQLLEQARDRLSGAKAAPVPGGGTP